MLASIIKSTSTMVSNTEAAKRFYIKKIIEKNKAGMIMVTIPGFSSWSQAQVPQHPKGEVESWMYRKPPVYRQLGVLVTKENQSLLRASWVAPSVHTDSLQLTNWSISFPCSLLSHSACADGSHSRLEALHNISLKHTVYSVKKEIHMTSFISIVCLSHLQSNVF